MKEKNITLNEYNIISVCLNPPNSKIVYLDTRVFEKRKKDEQRYTSFRSVKFNETTHTRRQLAFHLYASFCVFPTTQMYSYFLILKYEENVAAYFTIALYKVRS